MHTLHTMCACVFVAERMDSGLIYINGDGCWPALPCVSSQWQVEVERATSHTLRQVCTEDLDDMIGTCAGSRRNCIQGIGLLH